jgi:CBS domain-containing protein
MNVSDVMVKNPVKVGPDTSIREVARLMRDRSIASVIIVEDDKPLGIITERDLVRRVLASDADPDALKAKDKCTKPVVTTPQTSSVDSAVGIMNSYDIRRVVVVDEKNGNVVGILTTDDLWRNFRELSEELAVNIMALARSKARALT